MPVIKAGVFDLDYADTGSGPAVVLVHSSASGHRQWQRLVETLQSRYRVIAVNLFGYGKTNPWPGTRPLIAADQAELVAAAAKLVGEPVALIGHSLGGAVALEAAVKLSDRVRVLIAFEPILFGHLKVYGPASAYDEIAGVARRYNELARIGDWILGLVGPDETARFHHTCRRCGRCVATRSACAATSTDAACHANRDPKFWRAGRSA
jgi:pimeloyl-ACP methyl ester carboxylesterase